MACSLRLPLNIGHALPKPRSLDDAELESLAPGDEISSPNDMPLSKQSARLRLAQRSLPNQIKRILKGSSARGHAGLFVPPRREIGPCPSFTCRCCASRTNW